ncbi:RHS repeat domain-containing protein [Hymenobacter properus]|uniref:Uncharacterized protein n=1 Tax=Hymenobacter properus TaxID=2791026 RepID=A0A931BB39_9BACT|nr:hypothetical protein [Hymenobacter properus]MBF9140499.1 hypothetical protein [Hymenobacter properus]MBR7719306.1 hypothetical protein [Microvirga sp. SRT04]
MLRNAIGAGAGLAIAVLLPFSGHGQVGQPAQTATVTTSMPLQLPLVFSLNVLPQHLSADDSLARLHYARQHVKTVVMRQSGRRDTTDYFELDRRGNQTLIAKPYFGQHRRQRFDKQNRLVALDVLPMPDDPRGSQTVFEPAKQLYTTYALVGQPDPVLWQQTHQTQRGDTVTLDALFQPLPGMAGASARQRLQVRSYPLGRDTTATITVTYDAADQPTEFLANYAVKRTRLLVETGKLDFRPALSAGVTPTPELLRQARHRRARFVPGNRYEYDAQGLLVRAAYMADTTEGPRLPSKSSAKDGSWSMTMRSETRLSGYVTRYVRNAAGQLTREERNYQLRTGTADATARQLYRPSVISYEYDAKGLLLRKTDSASLNGKPSVYEYEYTFY